MAKTKASSTGVTLEQKADQSISTTTEENSVGTKEDTPASSTGETPESDELTKEKESESGNTVVEKDNEEVTIGTSTVRFMSSNPGKNQVHQNSAVKFQVNYSEDFKAKKYWKNGDIIEVSKESAKQFEEKGIGKEIK